MRFFYLILFCVKCWPVVVLANPSFNKPVYRSVSAKSAVVEKTLAVVEGKMISLMDLKEVRRRLKAGFFNDSAVLALFNKSKLKISDKHLLDFMIYKKLIEISAEEQKITIEEKQVNQEIYKKRTKKKLSKKAFSRWLVRHRWTSSSYREFLRKSLLRQLFIQREVGEKIRLSDEDLNAYALKKEKKASFYFL